MNWNSSLHKNILQSGICILLCAAILLGLLLPGIHMSHSQPESPLDNEAIREIAILKVGDDAEELDDIVVPNEDSVKPTEPEETEPPEETQPEESQPEETEPEETEPEETQPEETKPEETEPTDPDDGEEDEGNDDGDEGEEE